jgi:glycerol-1-phosphate dehydrogenase [NAD(P)+]
MNFLVKNYAKFSLQDEKLLKLLIEILLISGASMTKAGGSYPASQSEHLIAHTLEMKYPKKMHKILHGQQIAVTVLTSASLQEKFLKSSKAKSPQLIVEKDFEKKLAKYFGKKIAEECAKECAKKNTATEKALNFKVVERNWKGHHKKLSKILLREESLKKIFQHFKIKTSCQSLGISDSEYKEAVSYAKFIRDRFTCLDLLI